MSCRNETVSGGFPLSASKAVTLKAVRKIIGERKSKGKGQKVKITGQ
jgi:hypothetical protein